jgi:NAD(P)-dependent dehydrogenase (short-subunit alcohol dehydrogenase family)
LIHAQYERERGVARVTGSTSHIGKAIAGALAHCGATVVVNGRNQEAGMAVLEEISSAGGTACFEAADLLRAES